MKLNTKHIRFIIPALAILGTAAFAGLPALRKTFIPARSAVKEDPFTRAPDKKQEAILKELTTVLRGLDSMRTGTITGTIRAQDLADSSNSMQAGFCYSRNDSIGYYRFGDNEMVSLKDAYIMIAHDVKKIFLSAPREVINPLKVPVQAEADFLWKEGYKVERTVKGALTEISLSSSTHASCREYRVSFDSAGIVRHSFMRITDHGAPQFKERDKLVNVDIISWEKGKVRRDLLQLERYISIHEGVARPAVALQGYELLTSNE